MASTSTAAPSSDTGARPVPTENPTLFSETYAMAFSAAAIFCVAEVREAARNGTIDAPEVISLPVSVDVVISAFTRNTAALQRCMKKADYDFLASMKRQMDDGDTLFGASLEAMFKETTVHYFGDDDSKTESVYVLVRNPVLRRIVLCFRGSITVTDWIKDCKVVVGSIENPLLTQPGQPKVLGVHLGFREYLYSVSRNGSMRAINDKVRTVVRSLKRAASTDATPAGSQQMGVGDKGTVGSSNSDSQEPTNPAPDAAQEKQSSRLERILQELQDLRVGNEDYSIYVTGHSLGGALALLTALEMAAIHGRPGQPVTFVGVGNPRAATVAFRDAVETMEGEGKMRCLGVHNNSDIVPMIPTSTVGSKRQFCQVGFEMLIEEGKFEMRYLPKTNAYWQDMRDATTRMGLALFRADKIAGRHHYVTYLSILKSIEKPLSELHLNDYYNHVVKPGLYPGSEKALAPMNVTIETG